MNRSLAAYFIILATLCGAIIAGALLLGQQSTYLAQVYMLTPAIAALVTRLFFYGPRFSDAHLRLGRLADYGHVWLISVGIAALSYVLMTVFGAVTWDLSGRAFLDNMSEQLAAAGQDMNASLPPGMTPLLMLWLYFVGGLTILNVMPGLVTGLGEEFGHRGFMAPLLGKRLWLGILFGAWIWYAWHWPLMLIMPPGPERPLWVNVAEFAIKAIAIIGSHIYLLYAYAKSRSIFVAAIAHIVMNNASMSLSYLAAVQDPLLANLALAVTMLIVVAVLYAKGQLAVIGTFLAQPGDRPRPATLAAPGIGK